MSSKFVCGLIVGSTLPHFWQTLIRKIHNRLFCYNVNRGSIEMVKLLIKNEKIDQSSLDNALIMAIESKNIDMVKQLIKDGANVNKPDTYDNVNIALKKAIDSECLSIIEIILSLVKLNDRQLQWFVLLAISKKKGGFDIIKLIIEKMQSDLPLSREDVKGNFDYLSKAIDRTNDLKLLQYLIDKGAHVNYNNSDALVKAIKRYRYDQNIIDILIANGINIKPHMNLFFNNAVDEGRLDWLILCEQNGLDLLECKYQILERACRSKRDNIIRYITEKIMYQYHLIGENVTADCHQVV